MKEQVELAALAGAGLIGGVWKYGIRPELTARRGWLAIGIGVVAYELACPIGETLSEGADRALEDHRALVMGAACLTAAHLINVLPAKWDPLHQMVEAARLFSRPQLLE